MTRTVWMTPCLGLVLSVDGVGPYCKISTAPREGKGGVTSFDTIEWSRWGDHDIGLVEPDATFACHKRVAEGGHRRVTEFSDFRVTTRR